MIPYFIKELYKKNKPFFICGCLLVVSLILNVAVIHTAKEALNTCDAAISTAEDYQKLYEDEKSAHNETKKQLETLQTALDVCSTENEEVMLLYNQSMNVIAKNSLLSYVDTDNKYAQTLNLTEVQNGPVYLFSDTIIENGYYGDFPTMPYDNLTLTEEDISWLEKLVECESGGLSRDSKSFVVCTILNRVLSDEFPNTVTEVIFDSGQFTPVSTGKINRITPSDDTISAVKYTLASGIDTTNGALYFGNMVDIEQFNKTAFSWFNTLDCLFEYEGHTFYK